MTEILPVEEVLSIRPERVRTRRDGALRGRDKFFIRWIKVSGEVLKAGKMKMAPNFFFCFFAKVQAAGIFFGVSSFVLRGATFCGFPLKSAVSPIICLAFNDPRRGSIMTVGVSVVLSRQTIPSNWATVSSATGRTSADGKKKLISLWLFVWCTWFAYQSIRQHLSCHLVVVW